MACHLATSWSAVLHSPTPTDSFRSQFFSSPESGSASFMRTFLSQFNLHFSIRKMSDVAKEFQAVASIPFVTSACLLSPQYTNPSLESSEKEFVLHSTWSQRDLVRMEKTSTNKSYRIFTNASGALQGYPIGLPVDNTNELRSTYSSDGSLKAIFAKFRPKNAQEDKEAIEIYGSFGKLATNDLAASKRHGKFYTDAELGGFELNPAESSTHLMFVAEKYRPKPESFFDVTANKFPEDPELANKALGQEFVYREDWGEQLEKKVQPVLCVLDWNDNNVSILDNVPENVSPAQPVWTSDGGGVVFVGFDNLPEKLGLIYCPVRKSRLYYLALGQSKMALPLTFADLSVRSPRFSPDGTSLVYLENEVGGPHFQASRLMKIDWKNQQATPEVVVPIPLGNVKQKDFPGLYTGTLPKRCWAADGFRLVLHSNWRSSQQILIVNTQNKTISSLTGPAIFEGVKLPKWDLLDVHEDFVVAMASAPNVCPRLYIARLPAAGKEVEVKWVLLDEGAAVDRDLEKEIQLMEWDVEVIKDPASGLDFEAVWMFPSLKRNPPVILWPHGGPHSCSLPAFDVFITALIRMEFAVIFVNYRGSSGFGEKSLRSLLGKIGTNDVEDCFRALDVVLGKKHLNDKETDIFYQGGSHGGFLGAHLIGQFPDIFKACVLRNPVINLASKFTGTEIPDWGYVECGLEYKYEDPPFYPPYEQLLARSPIMHAHKIKTPTMIVLGDMDRRVTPMQGLELHRALRLKGVPSMVLRYPHCSHPIGDIDAESDSFVHMVNWFRRFATRR